MNKQHISKLYDPIRKCWVVQTPEEVVRQNTLQWMILQGGYIPENIIIERSLDLGIFQKVSSRRLDIAYVEARSLSSSAHLYLIIECKAKITGAQALARAKRQVLGYQWQLPSIAVALASDSQAWYCWTHEPENWMQGIPHVNELRQQAIKLKILP